jgi:hypothetical protein
VEPLEDRGLLSADVVLEWNQLLLNTVKANGVLPFVLSRDAAIVHAAVYDAVNAIDRSYTPQRLDGAQVTPVSRLLLLQEQLGLGQGASLVLGDESGRSP